MNPHWCVWILMMPLTNYPSLLQWVKQRVEVVEMLFMRWRWKRGVRNWFNFSATRGERSTTLWCGKMRWCSWNLMNKEGKNFFSFFILKCIRKKILVMWTQSATFLPNSRNNYVNKNLLNQITSVEWGFLSHSLVKMKMLFGTLHTLLVMLLFFTSFLLSSDKATIEESWQLFLDDFL